VTGRKKDDDFQKCLSLNITPLALPLFQKLKDELQRSEELGMSVEK